MKKSEATAFPGTTIGSGFATSASAHKSFFGGEEGLLSLWVAEPYLPLAPAIVEAMQARAAEGWYGYETRPSEVFEEFSGWMRRRHGWDTEDLQLLPSPSIGASMGIILDLVTRPEDRVVLQPPVFTDFKPLVQRSAREVARNSLVLSDGRYTMDIAALKEATADPRVTAMILCNPHNPVGRTWTAEELTQVAETCARNGVFVIADEIHADLVLAPHRFTPFATVAEGAGLRWAAVHGPIKTFGVAGLCETLLITTDDEVAEGFSAESRRLHLARKNAFGLAAFRAGYRDGAEWLDGLLQLVAGNGELLRNGLPEPIRLVEPEATYLAWLDLRDLGMDVPELTEWLPAKAGLALSPGHWFGREGAGFARMSIAVAPEVIEEAIRRLSAAVG